MSFILVADGDDPPSQRHGATKRFRAYRKGDVDLSRFMNRRNRRQRWPYRGWNLCRPRHGESVSPRRPDMLYADLARFNLTSRSRVVCDGLSHRRGWNLCLPCRKCAHCLPRSRGRWPTLLRSRAREILQLAGNRNGQCHSLSFYQLVVALGLLGRNKRDLIFAEIAVHVYSECGSRNSMREQLF